MIDGCWFISEKLCLGVLSSHIITYRSTISSTEEKLNRLQSISVAATEKSADVVKEREPGRGRLEDFENMLGTRDKRSFSED